MACPSDPILPPRPNILKFLPSPSNTTGGGVTKPSSHKSWGDKLFQIHCPFSATHGHSVWNTKSALRHNPAFGLVIEGSVVDDAVVEDGNVEMFDFLTLPAALLWVGCILLLKVHVFMMSFDFPVWHRKKLRTNLLESPSSWHLVSYCDPN